MLKKLPLVVLLLLSFLFSPSVSTAQVSPPVTPIPEPMRCGSTDIRSNQNAQQWDVTTCITAATKEEIERVQLITAVCRQPSVATIPIIGEQTCSCHYDSSPINLFCAPAKQTKGVGGQYPILFDIKTNRYYTCFTIENITRDVGVMEIRTQDASGTSLCDDFTVDVNPGNYDWWEGFDNLLETRFGVSLPIYEDPTERDQYDLTCSTVTGKWGVNTAIGCVAVEPVEFTKDFLTISIGIGGGIGLLLLLYGVALIVMSGGNPQKVLAGKEAITSVVQGLLLIALSIAALSFIGINILNLPGLQ